MTEIKIYIYISVYMITKMREKPMFNYIKGPTENRLSLVNSLHYIGIKNPPSIIQLSKDQINKQKVFSSYSKVNIQLQIDIHSNIEKNVQTKL